MTEDMYLGQETIFKSYNSIRNAIFSNDFTSISLPHHNPTVYVTHEKTLPKPKPVLTKFQDDPNILLAIQNNPNIMHFVSNCKSHKDLLAYIFIEENGFINFIARNPYGFPLILMKLPVDEVYIFTRTINCYYGFPIKDMIQKDVKYAKKNTYNIIYKKNDTGNTLNNVQFKYELFNTDNTINTSFTLQNNRIGELKEINNLFKIKTDIKPTDDVLYLSEIQNINITVLRHITDVHSLINFSHKSLSKPTFKIVLSNNKLNFVSISSRRTELRELATAENSILWNHSGSELEFKLMPFENLFKANFNKIYSFSDRVYYIFGSFCNITVFVKFISPILIKEKPSTNSLRQLFGDKYQFLECYYCIN
jgi:hypothetical protein